jgi:hypothetical protein
MISMALVPHREEEEAEETIEAEEEAADESWKQKDGDLKRIWKNSNATEKENSFKKQ